MVIKRAESETRSKSENYCKNTDNKFFLKIWEKSSEILKKKLKFLPLQHIL